jgi:hypothetical protein
MPSSPELYPLVCAWVQALPAPTSLHPAALRAVAHLVTALLIGQSLRPSALMRALPSPLPVPACQRYKRVARAWTRPWLSPAWLTPRLVRAALAWSAPTPPAARRRGCPIWRWIACTAGAGTCSPSAWSGTDGCCR